MALVCNGSSAINSANFGASRPAAYTIACWFKANAVPSPVSFADVLSVSTTAPYPNARGSMSMPWSHTLASERNTLNINTINTTYVTTPSAAGSSAGVWYNFVGVYNGSSITHYQNGEVVSSAGAVVTAPAPIDWAIYGGRTAGKTCMITYWGIGLSAEDVRAIGVGIHPQMVRAQHLGYLLEGFRSTIAKVGTTDVATNITYDDDFPRLYL